MTEEFEPVENVDEKSKHKKHKHKKHKHNRLGVLYDYTHHPRDLSRYPHTDLHTIDLKPYIAEIRCLKDWCISLTKLLQALADLHNKDVEGIYNEVIDLCNKIQELIDLYAEYLQTYIDNENDYLQASKDYRDTVYSKFLSIHDELSKILSDICAVIEMIYYFGQQVQTDIFRLRKNVTKIIERLKEIESNISSLQQDIWNLQNDLNNIEIEINNLQTQINNIEQIAYNTYGEKLTTTCYNANSSVYFYAANTTYTALQTINHFGSLSSSTGDIYMTWCNGWHKNLDTYGSYADWQFDSVSHVLAYSSTTRANNIPLEFYGTYDNNANSATITAIEGGVIGDASSSDDTNFCRNYYKMKYWNQSSHAWSGPLLSHSDFTDRRGIICIFRVNTSSELSAVFNDENAEFSFNQFGLNVFNMAGYTSSGAQTNTLIPYSWPVNLRMTVTRYGNYNVFAIYANTIDDGYNNQFGYWEYLGAKLGILDTSGTTYVATGSRVTFSFTISATLNKS